MWIGGWSRGSLDDTPRLGNVIPPFGQLHLLGRRTGPLSFRTCTLALSDAFTAAFGLLLCKSRLRLLPLHTATVFRYVVSPAATALMHLPRIIASPGEVGAHTN